MNQCIKCGREIPQGELFCLECSMNPDTTPLDAPHAPRIEGRMQTPRPVKQVPQRPAAPVHPQKPKSRRKLVVAFVVVCLLLAASVAMQLRQYGSMQTKENRIRAKEADLALRETEIDELYEQVDSLNDQLEATKATVTAKEAEIDELASRLAASQSSQSQGEYDLSTKQQELERLEEENKELLALSDDLEKQIDELKKTISQQEQSLKAAEKDQTKADFLDTYVVFVENDKTGYYHTYDCENFAKSSFWAYSRKLAEAQGFRPCPVCGGTP